MDYSVFIFILTLILIPIILGVIASVLYYIYDAMTTSRKGSLKNLVSRSFLSDFKKRNNIFLPEGIKNSLNYVLILYLIISLILTYIIADFVYFNTLNLKFNLVLLSFCLTIPLAFSGINHSSPQLYTTSKRYFLTFFDYYIPILLSILSLIILISSYGINLSDLSIMDILSFQNTSQIQLFDGIIPSLFIFLNPFAAIAFFTGMMGIFRTYRKDFYKENSINQKLFSKILRNVCFLSIILLFVFLFIGGGYFFNENLILNILMCSFISIIIIFALSLIDYGRPKLFIERKIWSSINLPLIFSMLALMYSIFLLFFDFSFINLILN